MFEKKTRYGLLAISLIALIVLWTKIVFSDTPFTVAEILTALALAFFIVYLIVAEEKVEESSYNNKTRVEESSYNNKVMVVYETPTELPDQELARRKYLIKAIKEFDALVMPYQVAGIMVSSNLSEEKAIVWAQTVNAANLTLFIDCTTNKIFSYFVFNIVNGNGLVYTFSKTPEELEEYNEKITEFINEKINGFFEL